MKQKKTFKNKTHIFCSKAGRLTHPPFLGLKNDSDIKHVSRVGFAMNVEQYTERLVFDYENLLHGQWTTPRPV